jgi:hypothetical protein
MDQIRSYVHQDRLQGVGAGLLILVATTASKFSFHIKEMSKMEKDI